MDAIELNIAIDTELRDRAIQAVDEFVRDHSTPVSRAQIAGLLQLVVIEPSKLVSFATNQKLRAQKKLVGMKDGPKHSELDNEVAFWDLIQFLCEGKKPKCPWSLLQESESAIPKKYHLEKLPPGTALSSEKKKRRDRVKTEKDDWVRAWNLAYYPGFFRHFCAHYVYRMPPPKKNQ